MTEENKRTNQKASTARTAESKARRTADKATAPASQAAKGAAGKAGEAAKGAAGKAGEAAKGAAGKAGEAASAAKSGAERSAESARTAARTAAKGVEAGRQAVVTASGHVATTAKTAWTVIAHRKIVAAGVGAGLTALSAASYAVGRRAERGAHGPLTRLTGGRI
ncbi:hypothetical protein ACFCXS_32505 [Streptomyces sp. NPDC056373]|uniref:hypothetical protein n=1 Tax=Streptomyces sp. NPDC056373 TaxID=3345798 RepID=UPI0035D821FE